MTPYLPERVWLERAMSQAQTFACAWSLVGGIFDDGSALDLAEGAKRELRALLEASPAVALLQRLLDPSDLGHAVSAEVRDAARQVLGLRPVEGATRPGDEARP